MNLDFLKPALGDELFAQVSTALKNSGLNIVNIADGSYIPKAKFDEKLQMITQLQTDLATARQQVQDEQAKNATVNDLQTKVNQLTQDLSARDQQINRMSLDYDIRDFVRGSKPKDLDIVVGLLNKDAIKKEGDKLTGIEDQLNTLKTDKAFLFETEPKPAPNGGFAGRQEVLGGSDGSNPNAAINNAIRQMAGRAV